MIISISGKMGSGKDTVGNIMHYLLHNKQVRRNSAFHPEIDYSKGFSGFRTKKFADKLKDIACMLIGCTRDQLEDQEFKKTVLGSEWSMYRGESVDGIPPLDITKNYRMESSEEVFLTKEEALAWGKLLHNGYSEIKITVREFLQKLGTDAMRDVIHENVWVNALMCDYVIPNPQKGQTYSYKSDKFPNWIITDTRFPNELEAVKAKEGITIKVSSPLRKGDKFKWKDFEGIITEEIVHSVAPNFKLSGGYCYYTEESKGTLYIQSKDVIQESHPSETALDDAKFDYEIVNDGSMEELISKVEVILIKEKLL